ncbi:fibronectin type III domain-containing protein [Streptomyces sp. NPDC051909]|uniref:fibronectin type III domain-containing protein n=1 Tax=Streptomyces sp. NPDC051909 TaxID=3154944 RepID=UPI00344AA437
MAAVQFSPAVGMEVGEKSSGQEQKVEDVEAALKKLYAPEKPPEPPKQKKFSKPPKGFPSPPKAPPGTMKPDGAAPSSVSATGYGIVGTFDALTHSETNHTITVAGWSVITASPSSKASILIWDDAGFSKWSSADKYRPDVGRSYPSAGPYHGFNETYPESTSDGVRTVCARAYWWSDYTNLGCFTYVARHNPFGNLDVASLQDAETGRNLHVGGWAVDPDTPRQPTSVRIFQDGQLATTLNADTERPDVGAAYPLYGGRHGFEGVIIPSQTPGYHEVCVVYVNVGYGSGSSCTATKQYYVVGDIPEFALSVDHVTSTTATLRFGWNENIERMQFEKQLVEDVSVGEWEPAGERATNGEAFQVTGLSPDKSYRFRATASNWRTSVTATSPVAHTLKSAPTPVSGLRLDRASETSLSIQFQDNSTTEDRFLITYANSQTPGVVETVTFSSRPGTGPALHTLTGLTYDTEYWISVQSVADGAEWSTPASLLASTAGPRVTEFKAVPVSSTCASRAQYDLSWQVSGAKQVVVTKTISEENVLFTSPVNTDPAARLDGATTDRNEEAYDGSAITYKLKVYGFDGAVVTRTLVAAASLQALNSKRAEDSS